ncbi:MAG TPA: hypothetical protein VL346_02310 [Acidobacteriaceae bacterium]|nr:hypothetical protein [Acidobacteriaceae bacterium]
MTSEIILQPTPDALALPGRREELARLRVRLAERESDLAQLRAQLKAFESRYFRQVGVLYAELDEVEARIVEREVDLYDSDAARRRAEEARQRARESHDAAFEHDAEPEVVEPAQSLKALFRELARRIHPDFARDEAEQKHFTLLMARANLAYRTGDAETLQRLLDDHREIHSSLAGEGPGVELLRIERQIRHAQRDVAALDSEEHNLKLSEIGQLYRDAEAATAEHRDLLTELAMGLREEIAEAQKRFEEIDRQIRAHGR